MNFTLVSSRLEATLTVSHVVDDYTAPGGKTKHYCKIGSHNTWFDVSFTTYRMVMRLKDEQFFLRRAL